MNKITIITKMQSGLAVDGEIIRHALDSNRWHTTTVAADRGRFRNLLFRQVPIFLENNHIIERRFANVFCEKIHRKWMGSSKRNILIPNQEWCDEETIYLLSKMDAIFCKTKYADSIFSSIGAVTEYIGFSGRDRFLKTVPKNFGEFIHIAGKSLQKGTRVIAKIWAKHPEWPKLTIVSSNSRLYSDIEFGSNVSLIGYANDIDIAQMQNRAGIHLCPSEAEGFGHTISEGLSCGAVVITTDAPPMNELVAPDRGFLVPFAESKPQALGMNYYVDPIALENTIRNVIESPLDTLEYIGRTARSWFLTERLNFVERINTALLKYSEVNS